MRLAALIFGLAGPAVAAPPEPCFSAETFDSALVGLEAEGWTAVASQAAIPAKVESLLGWSSVQIDYLGRYAVWVGPHTHDASVARLREALAIGDARERRIRVLSRGDEALLLIANQPAPQSHGTMYCYVASEDVGESTTTDSGISTAVLLEAITVEREGGLLRVLRLDPERLSEVVGATEVPTTVYQTIHPLSPEAPSSAP